MALVFIANDLKTAIPGSPTLWDDLMDWITGAVWVGDVPFHRLAEHVESLDLWPDCLIRNGSYFRQIRKSYPQIALFQDIFPDGSEARRQQITVGLGSKLVVFNSAFTRSKFPELESVPYRIIPLPVDFDLFRPMPEVEKVSDVCWIGAKSHVKGYDILVELIQQTDFTFTLIMKDDIKLQHPRVRCFNRVPHSELPAIINSCRIGLCTSRMETQHLAGIEMGACGLYVLAPDVGIYHEYSSIHAIDMADAAQAISLALPPRSDADFQRQMWISRGLDRASCKAAWLEAVEWATKSS